MKKSCQVLVATINPAKTLAIEKAFSMILCEARIKAIDIGALMPKKQPINTRELICCALKRINLAKKTENSNNYDYIVSVEAGLVDFNNVKLEGQIALVESSTGEVSIGFSPLFPLPNKWIEEIDKGQELEQIVEEEIKIKRIGENIGVIGRLTQGVVTRSELSFLATLMALLPFANREIYKKETAKTTSLTIARIFDCEKSCI